MYHTYNKILAWVLLVSQLLTSCVNFNKPTKQELIDLEKEVNKQQCKPESIVPWSDVMMVTSASEQKIIVRKEAHGNWQAELVKVKTANEILPIVFGPGYSLLDLFKASVQEQKQMVHLVASEQDTTQPSYIYIGERTFLGQPISNELQIQSKAIHTTSSGAQPDCPPVTNPVKISTLNPRLSLFVAPAAANNLAGEQQILLDPSAPVVVENFVPPSSLANAKQPIESKAVGLPSKYGGMVSKAKPTRQEQPASSSRLSGSLGESNWLGSARKQAQNKPTPAEFLSKLATSLPTISGSTIAEQAHMTEASQLCLAKGEYLVHLSCEAGHWIAHVREYGSLGLSRNLTLPVYLAPGFSINELRNYATSWHKRHIHVLWPEQTATGKGYVYIGSVGLLGGGNEGSKTGGGKDRDGSASSGGRSDRSSQNDSARSSSGNDPKTFSKEGSTTTTSSSKGNARSTGLDNAAASVLASSLGFKTELPTYHFPSLTSDCSYYRTPPIDLPSFDASHATRSMMGSSSSHGSSRTSRPSYAGRSSASESASSSSQRTTPSCRPLPVSVSEKEVISSASRGSSSTSTPVEVGGLPLNLENAANEIKKYRQALQASDNQVIPAEEQEKGERFLEELGKLKQAEEAKYQRITKAYMIGENSAIGDKILLDQLKQCREDISSLQGLAEQLSATLVQHRSHISKTARGGNSGQDEG